MGDLNSQETPPFNLQEATATSQPTQVCRGVVYRQSTTADPWVAGTCVYGRLPYYTLVGHFLSLKEVCRVTFRTLVTAGNTSRSAAVLLATEKESSLPT